MKITKESIKYGKGKEFFEENVNILSPIHKNDNIIRMNIFNHSTVKIILLK